MNGRQLTRGFIFGVCLLGVLPAFSDDPDPNEMTWRRDSKPLDHAGIEELARRVGYAGGRLETGEAARGVARNNELLAIRGDAMFRESLHANGLELLDQIDNRATGLQAVLVRDTRGSGRVYAIMRGTEFGESTNNEGARDGFADANTSKIGYHQYEADKATLAQWAQKHRGNLTVTGHSLGAALAQRFVLDHPAAIKEAVVFNPPGVGEESCNRLARKQLPPVTYYVHPRDPASLLGGPCHVPGKVFMVEGGATETFNEGSKGLAEHRGYMLRGGTVVDEIDFYQWQSDRTRLINDTWATVGALNDVRKESWIGKVNPIAENVNMSTVHKLVGDSQMLVTLYRQIVDASDASSAKVREAGAARIDGMTRLDEMRMLLAQMRGAGENCQSAAAVRDRVIAHAAQVVRFADAADNGFQYVQKQAKECKSVEAITVALNTHDKSRALMKSASDHYGQMREGEQLLNDLLAAATQGQGLKDAASAKLAQARATLERMRSLASDAEGLRHHTAAATTDYLRMHAVMQKMMATLPYTVVQEATRRMMEYWDRPAPSIADLPAERGVAASAIEAFEGAVRAAEAEFKNLDGLQACNAVVMPQDRIGAADGAMVNMGLDGMGDGTREAAQSCLARLRTGKNQQAATATRRPPANSELDDLLNDVAANKVEAQSARRGQQAMQDDNRDKAQQVGGQSFREWRGEAQTSENTTPPMMDGLLTALTEAVRQVQNSSAQRPPADYPRETPRQAGTTSTAGTSATPRTPPPPRAARPSQEDRQFIIVGSARTSSDSWFRDHVACRHKRILVGPSFIEGREREIADAVAQLKARGHVEVDVKYGAADSGERLSREWDQIYQRGAEACAEAVRREKLKLEPR